MSFRPHRVSPPLNTRSMANAIIACIGITLAVACADDNADATGPNSARQYGAAQTLGNGQARTYVVMQNGKPIELGVALSENALEGLPAAVAAETHGDHSHESAHAMATELNLELPAGHGTQYKFVQLDWNASGHDPVAIYGVPHFDFHFYNVSQAERDAIVPTSASYVQSARNAPDAQFARAFFVNPAVALGAPAEAVAVPRMGVHWLDSKAPELQGMVGNPQGYRPFTTTFIQGAWNGKFIFDEPMITRAHLLAKRTATADSVRDQVLPLTAAAKVSPAGYYAGAYRIAYDAVAKEYRVALTSLTYRE